MGYQNNNLLALDNYSDNFQFHKIAQSGHLSQMEKFPWTDRPTYRQTNLLMEAPFRSLKITTFGGVPLKLWLENIYFESIS